MKYLSLSEPSNVDTLFSTLDLVEDAHVKPVIAADECLIKTSAIGVNRADILQKQGKYPAPEGESTIIGIEVSGEIIACGDNVNSWQVGERVFCIVSGGGYAEYVKVNASHLIRTPDNMSDIEAAACAETFLTAYQSLFTIGHNTKQQSMANKVKTSEPQSVLIHAGASGVGSAAIQLAKHAGYYVVTTVSSKTKQQACLTLGADVALNYLETDFVAWSKAHQPQGYNRIIDVVAGDYVNKNIKVAALDSAIVILSLLGGRFSDKVDIARLLQKRVTISASTLRNRSNEYKSQLIQNFITDFYSLLVNKQITPLLDSIYAWHDVEKAHHKMESNQNIGKIVLTPN